MIFNDAQLDLLQETFNIGVGQAAYALSELAGGEEIILSVPKVSVKSLSGLIEDLGEAGNFCGVSEVFSGTVPGRATMLYAAEESLELVRLLLGESIPASLLSEMEAEALCEVGNIVLNACISSLANLLEVEIRTEVPRLHVGTAKDVLGFLGPMDQSVVHLRMNFMLARHQLQGHLGFTLELESATSLIEMLDSYYQNLMGEG